MFTKGVIMPKIIKDLEAKLMEEANRQIEDGGYSAMTIRSVAKACGDGATQPVHAQSRCSSIRETGMSSLSAAPLTATESPHSQQPIYRGRDSEQD